MNAQSLSMTANTAERKHLQSSSYVVKPLEQPKPARTSPAKTMFNDPNAPNNPSNVKNGFTTPPPRPTISVSKPGGPPEAHTSTPAEPRAYQIPVYIDNSNGHLGTGRAHTILAGNIDQIKYMMQRRLKEDGFESPDFNIIVGEENFTTDSKRNVFNVTFADYENCSISTVQKHFEDIMGHVLRNELPRANIDISTMDAFKCDKTAVRGISEADYNRIVNRQMKTKPVMEARTKEWTGHLMYDDTLRINAMRESAKDGHGLVSNDNRSQFAMASMASENTLPSNQQVDSPKASPVKDNASQFLGAASSGYKDGGFGVPVVSDSYRKTSYQMDIISRNLEDIKTELDERLGISDVESEKSHLNMSIIRTQQGVYGFDVAFSGYKHAPAYIAQVLGETIREIYNSYRHKNPLFDGIDVKAGRGEVKPISPEKLSDPALFPSVIEKSSSNISVNASQFKSGPSGQATLVTLDTRLLNENMPSNDREHSL